MTDSETLASVCILPHPSPHSHRLPGTQGTTLRPPGYSWHPEDCSGFQRCLLAVSRPAGPHWATQVRNPDSLPVGPAGTQRAEQRGAVGCRRKFSPQPKTYMPTCPRNPAGSSNNQPSPGTSRWPKASIRTQSAKPGHYGSKLWISSPRTMTLKLCL